MAEISSTRATGMVGWSVDVDMDVAVLHLKASAFLLTDLGEAHGHSSQLAAARRSELALCLSSRIAGVPYAST